MAASRLWVGRSWKDAARPAMESFRAARKTVRQYIVDQGLTPEPSTVKIVGRCDFLGDWKWGMSMKSKELM